MARTKWCKGPPYLTLPSREDVLLPSAEVSDGPTAQWEASLGEQILDILMASDRIQHGNTSRDSDGF